MDLLRGSTPDFILTLPVDLTGKTVFVTFEQKEGVQVSLTGDELSIASDSSGSTIALRLTQEQTLGFTEGYADVQARWIDAEGKADGSAISSVRITRVLLDRVIEYDGE